MPRPNVKGKRPAAEVFAANPALLPTPEVFERGEPREHLSAFYIGSRGRPTTGTTWKLLEAVGIHNWFMVVDEDQAEAYREGLGEFADRVLVCPQRYSEPFDPVTNPDGTDFCDPYGTSKPGTPASKRNFIHDYSLAHGEKAHWLLDDDIINFAKEGHGRNKVLPEDFPIKEVLGYFEDFCDSIDGLALGELDNFGLSFNREKDVDLLFNVKTYTFIRITNGTGVRWRGRFNDDVLLGLEHLKRGFKTASCKLVTAHTRDTQIYGGGLTDLYKSEGTLKKSMMVPKVSPTTSLVVIRYGRIHHLTDWTIFRQGKI